MFSRVIALSTLGVGVTVFNVWDLPLWAWRSYAALVDEQERLARERANR